MKRNWLAIGIILLFIGVANPPGTDAKIPIASKEANTICASIIPMNNGTLSGYVTGTAMNPIEGARVRVYFHNTSRENYSDATGYYHVTDIPICNCTKNATCSKEGYYTEWVSLTIWENTTYNFTLTEKGHWLYVGGSGPGNYTRIQDAIDNASDGDTVFVYNYSSPYYENIKIKKSIKLLGENNLDTVIIGDGHQFDVIEISADNVEISGFTVQNSYTDEWSAGIAIFADDTLLTNDILCENANGVRVGTMAGLHHNNIISNNMIFNNTYNGIFTYNIKNCTICDNVVTSNKNGLRITYTEGANITRNTIKKNSKDGIDFWDSHKNLVEQNDISNNRGGIFSWTHSSQGIFQNNTFTSNAEDGIFIDQAYAEGDFIIQNNIIKFNARNGIRIQFSDKNIVQKNEIIGNKNGLYLLGAHRNKIQGNNFTDNIEYGVLIYSDYMCSYYNEFSFNNFLGNAVNAHDECKNIWFNIWKRKGNYWDDYIGEDNNGDGIGDTPFTIEGGENKDGRPLMEPCDNFTSYVKNNQYMNERFIKWCFIIMLHRFPLLQSLFEVLTR